MLVPHLRLSAAVLDSPRRARTRRLLPAAAGVNDHRRGGQQMMVHLDIATENLEEAVAWAVQTGAVLADPQPQDDVWGMLDPAGHPFCLF